MNPTSARAWLDKERGRQERHATLAGATLGVRRAAYFWYRVRFIAPRAVVRTVLHGIELYLLASLLPWSSMVPFFWMRAALFLATGFHWGWLEGLREDVRSLHAQRRLNEMNHRVTSWVLGTAVLGVLAFSAAEAWLLANPFEFHGFSVFDAFAFACALRFTVESLARTFHSSIYAVRRIHRPLWSLLLPDIFEPVLLLVLFPRWGLWSFSMVAALSGLLRGGLVGWFTRKAVQRLRAGPGTFRMRWNEMAGWRSMFRSVPAGLGNLSAQVDALFLFVLAASSVGGLAALIYFFRPLLVTAQGALRTFYFDLKRLEATTPEVLRRSYVRALGRMALVIGAVVGLTMALAGRFWHGMAEWDLLVLLVAFGLARSVFALAQVTSFAAKNYWMLASVGIFIWGALRALERSRWEAVPLLMGLCALLVFSSAILFWTTRQTRPERAVADLPDWLRRLGRCEGTVLFFSARIDQAARVRRALVVRRLLESQQACLHPFSRRLLLGFCPVQEASAQDEAKRWGRQLAESTLGSLGDVKVDWASNGTEAVKRLVNGQSAAGVPPLQKKLQAALQARSVGEVLSELTIELPEVQVLQPGQALQAYEQLTQRRLMAVAGFAGPRRGRGVFSHVSWSEGRPLLVLAPQHEANAAKLGFWEQALRDAELNAALQQALGGRPEALSGKALSGKQAPW